MLVSWKFLKKNKPRALSGIFLIGYSIARLISEQYRLPDAHIGYLLDTNWITLGIIYTLPMMAYGVYLIYISTISRPGSI
jgi:phosphatidylglycerol:prolipoprotein diacylglycerol transferase